MTGFFSKELIVNASGSVYQFEFNLVYFITAIVAGLTAFYSFRLISLTFFETPKGSKELMSQTHEAKWQVVVSFTALSLLAIFFGYFASDAFIGMGTDFFQNSMYILPGHEKLINTEFALGALDKNFASIISISGALLAVYFYNLQPFTLIDLKLALKPVYTFLNAFWNFDIMFVKGILNIGLSWGLTLSKVFDRGVLESLGPKGMSDHLFNWSDSLIKINWGNVGQYALGIFSGMIALFAILLFPMLVNMKLLILFGVSLLLIIPFSSKDLYSFR